MWIPLPLCQAIELLVLLRSVDNLLLTIRRKREAKINLPVVKNDTVKCKVKVAIEIGQCSQNFSEDSG